MVQKLTTKDTFTKEGAFVPRGRLVEVDEANLNGRERNLIDYDGETQLGVVEMSAVAPTGPNPKRPQQVPNDAVETIEGFVLPGATLVGEVTTGAETRIEAAGIGVGNTAQSDVAAALMADAGDGNGDIDGKPLDQQTKAELIATAEAGNVELETDDNKADIVRKIRAARAG